MFAGGVILADGGTGAAPIQAGFTDRTPIDLPNGDAPLLIVTDGAWPVLHGSSSPVPTGDPLLGFGDIFYNQIWVIPTTLSATNPKTGVPIPFKIWNAFLFDNELQDIVATDATGLTLGIEIGDVIGPLGLLTTSVTIEPGAPLTIDAMFFFDFELDTGTLHFTSSRAYVIGQRPEDGIKETWAWNTDIIVSDNGSEQRIALREYPMRSVNETLVFTETDEIRNEAWLMYGFFKGPVLAPYHQYGTKLKAKALAGDTAIEFNSSRTNLRDYGLGMISDRNGYQVVQLGVVDSDGAGLSYPLDRDFSKQAEICPVFSVIANLNSNLVRYNPDSVGKSQVSIREVAPQIPFVRPSNGVELLTFNDIPILNKNAIGTDFDQKYDTGSEIRDWGGVIEVRDRWLHTQLQFARTYNCQRIFEPLDWDWWFKFADYCKGSQGLFYLPTFRADFEVVVPANPSSSSLTIKGNDYELVYYDSKPFKQIVLTSKAGIHYANVTSVEAVAGDNTLFFDPPLPDDPNWAFDQRISFLLSCRIADDKFALTHYGTYTEVELSIRTVDE